jgi:hypothetical protein
MIKRRRRVKQTVDLRDRLMLFSDRLQKQASRMKPGQEKDALLKRARLAFTAAAVEKWVRTRGMKLPI